MVCGSSTFAAGKFAGKYLASRGRMSIDFNLCAGKFAGDLLQGACARLDGPLSAPPLTRSVAACSCGSLARHLASRPRRSGQRLSVVCYKRLHLGLPTISYQPR